MSTIYSIWLCVFLYICIMYTCIHEYMCTQIHESFLHPLNSIYDICWLPGSVWCTEEPAPHGVASFFYVVHLLKKPD